MPSLVDDQCIHYYLGTQTNIQERWHQETCIGLQHSVRNQTAQSAQGTIHQWILQLLSKAKRIVPEDVEQAEWEP
jgi:hypothetical protein